MYYIERKLKNKNGGGLETRKILASFADYHQGFHSLQCELVPCDDASYFDATQLSSNRGHCQRGAQIYIITSLWYLPEEVGG